MFAIAEGSTNEDVKTSNVDFDCLNPLISFSDEGHSVLQTIHLPWN